MIDQTTTLHVFRLLENLRRRKLNLKQIMSLTGRSRSTAFDYLKILRTLKFNIKLENGYLGIIETDVMTIVSIMTG